MHPITRAALDQLLEDINSRQAVLRRLAILRSDSNAVERLIEELTKHEATP